MTTQFHQTPGHRLSLLIADSDVVLCKTLENKLGERGFKVHMAQTAKAASEIVRENMPQYAVVALKLPDASGLKLVSLIRDLVPSARIVVLAIYPSIRTAVEAIKLGAIDYLAKPTSADEVVAALYRDRGDDSVPVGKKPMSVHRAAWEYISRVLHDNDGNISATARALSIDRRTLQRKLRKRPGGA
jgi:two-component system response regulator RegA